MNQLTLYYPLFPRYLIPPPIHPPIPPLSFSQLQRRYDSPRKRVSFDLCTPPISGIISDVPYPLLSRLADKKAAVVYYNPLINDASLHSLSSLNISPSDITKISLRGCGLLSSEAVTSIFHVYPNLIHLDLTGATKLKDNLICNKRISFANLKYIDLSESLMITNRLLDHLSQQCHQLAVIKMSGYPWPNELPSIGAGMFNLMSETAHTLLHLECRWARLTSGNNGDDNGGGSNGSRSGGGGSNGSRSSGGSGSSPLILGQFTRLRYLDLHGCAIDDAVVSALAGATGQLEHLDVGECHGITSASVLADLIWSNQQTLHLLDISRADEPFATTITLDFDLMTAIWSCPRLGTLRMSNSIACNGETEFWERTLYSVPDTGCRPSMTELDLRNSYALDDSGLLLLPQIFPNLRVLDVSGTILSEAAFASFMVQLAGHPLETLRMRGVLRELHAEAEFARNESLRCLDFADDDASEGVVYNLVCLKLVSF